MTCYFDADLLTFLDKRRSPLVTRCEKDSERYNMIAKWAFKCREQWDKNAKYIMCNDAIPYNVVGDYFVQSADFGSHIYCRTHSDFIAYVDETNQKTYKTVHIPEGKKLTETDVGDGYCIITVSNGDIQVY